MIYVVSLFHGNEAEINNVEIMKKNVTFIAISQEPHNFGDVLMCSTTTKVINGKYKRVYQTTEELSKECNNTYVEGFALACLIY